jgi:hypothetical protein
VAHLTGTGKFKLDEGQRAELSKYVESGGTLVIDAAGGSTQFAQSADAEIAAIFPGQQINQLPPDHAVFTAGGLKSPAIKYREYAQKVLGALKDTPRLQGIDRADRIVLFYSKEDLTGGLVGQPVDGIVGYTPATATDLMQRIVLYADGNGAKAPGATTKSAK